MTEQNQHINHNLSDEEFFDRAFQDLSPEDQAIVEGVTNKVNERVSKITGFTPAPSRPNWYLFGGVGAVLVAVVITLVMVNNNAPEEDALTNLVPVVNQDEEIADPEVQDAEDLQETETVENPVPEDEETPEPVNETMSADVANLISQINASNSGSGSDVETPVNMTEDVTERTTETTDQVVEYHSDPQQPVEMSVVSIEIFSERPILDDDKSTGNNTSVTDPNIGGATNNGGSNATYDPDDLPSYYGGQASLKAKLLELTNHITLEDAKGDMKTSVVYFKVSNKGEIEDVQIMAPISDEIDKAVTDAVNKLPLWSKGKKKWKLEYVISITFN